MALVLLHYDSASGAVKALLRPSVWAMKQNAHDLDTWFHSRPMTEGADAFLVVEDEFAHIPPKEPVHRLVVKQGQIYTIEDVV